MVVVTIIVVLLALLVPALDRAMYRAELVVCGANQRSAAAGLITYAMDQRRRWPVAAVGRTDVQTDWIGQAANPDKDLRPIIREYVELNLFVCPLTHRLKIKPEETHPDSHVLVNYDLWFSMQFKKFERNIGGLIDVNEVASGAGKFRIGDRFSWKEGQDENARTNSFTTLLSDKNMINVPSRQVNTTHPDFQYLWNSWAQDQVVVGADILGFTAGNARVVTSRWFTNQTAQRAPIEMNVAFDDGGVVLYNRVLWDDGRMQPVPALFNDQVPSHRTWIPPQ